MRPLLSVTLLIFFCMHSFAENNESMDALLDTFVYNSDLSKKTRLENAGNVIVITRKELDRMQARNLKDVLKSLPVLEYRENRLGIPDPAFLFEDLPFNSNSIRIYINNQEVTSGIYGSGLFLIGNIDIGFVDHIEVYSLNPSFEYSTEPARFLIKLYSKTPKRDKGSEASISFGSRGYNQKSFQYADIFEDVSVFTYFSRMDDRRKVYRSFDKDLSKDQDRYFFFGTISGKDQKLQLQVIQSDKDLFSALGPDYRPYIANNRTKYLHIGYENSMVENLHVSLVYEQGRSITDLAYENLTYYDEDFHIDVSDRTFTVDTQYKWNKWDNHELVMGIKYRYKYFNTNEMKYIGYDFPVRNFDTQSIVALYLEDHYSFSGNWLLTLGSQFSHVYNNAEVDDADLWLARVGVVYTNESWVAKTFVHSSEFLIEPYLYTTVTYEVQPKIETEKVKNITQEVQYAKGKHKLRTVAGYSIVKEKICKESNGDIGNNKKRGSQFFTYVDYTYKFSVNHTLSSFISYRHNENRRFIGDFDQYKAMVRALNRFDRFDFFNEVVFYRDTISQKNYMDYSVGVTYRYSDTLKFYLKGENVFDTAYEDYHTRGRYLDGMGKTYQPLETLYTSPIDQRITFTMEYLF